MPNEEDKYEKCPLELAGFRRVWLAELGSIVIGPDGKCICTAGCLDPDKHDGKRCTLEQLEALSRAAVYRRGSQSGYE